MTRPLPFTEAGLRRAIRAARKSGLRITGIRSDGTLLVNDGDNLQEPVAPPYADNDTNSLSKWGDVQA
jgi:hypothetical protein